MEINHDISSPRDIDHLVRAFYKKATADPVIGKFFTEVVQINWELHIPVIVNFWSTALLGEGDYRGNVMDAHIKLHKIEPMKKEHFDRWVSLWQQTIEEMFVGSKAEEAKQRGSSIAQIMTYHMQSH